MGSSFGKILTSICIALVSRSVVIDRTLLEMNRDEKLQESNPGYQQRGLERIVLDGCLGLGSRRPADANHLTAVSRLNNRNFPRCCMGALGCESVNIRPGSEMHGTEGD
jgi:hypothetical protein